MSQSNTDTGDTVISNQTEITRNDKKPELPKLPPINKLFPRESLITTAVNFLQNKTIRHNSLTQKQQFLRSKGLTSEEIQIACERAGIFTQDPNSTVINMGISTTTSQQSLMTAERPKITTFLQIKEILQSMALFSGVAYAIYVFYKKYIEPFLFGQKKKKTIDETLQEIDKKVEDKIGDVNRELMTIKETLTLNSQQQSQLINREFGNFKSDLDAIKGLLLNRKQFANPLSTVPPSIPAWQLSSSSHRRNSHSDNEKNDDAGSGSGSSETEVVTKNSDSSLEIM